MRLIDAVIKFVEKAAATSGLTPQSVLAIADPMINQAIRDRLSAVKQQAEDKMLANWWFPLPSKRADDTRHGLIGSAIYYLCETAISEPGIDNTAAGLLEAYLLGTISAQEDLNAVNIAGKEDALLESVSDLIADTLVPVGS